LNAMTIGKLAAAGGVGVETVRFYQRRGLLAEPNRNGGVRRYDQTDLSRLRFIRAAQAGGFTLAEIGELLALDATEDRARARELANKRIAEIDERIAALQSARKSLRRLANECAEGGDGRCPIIEAFEPS
jgi:MerR family mercuric resistance operon transcriptional regulator